MVEKLIDYTHEPAIDCRAYIASKKLRADVAEALGNGVSPEVVITMITEALGPQQIQGYLVTIGSHLVKKIAPLLGTKDLALQSEAANRLIEYAAMQASSRDVLRISAARNHLVAELSTLQAA